MDIDHRSGRTRLSADQIASARRALLGDHSDSLLAYARQLSYGASCDSEVDVTALARTLGWVKGQPAQLTRIGRMFADAAREYCNWIDDHRSFPIDDVKDLLFNGLVIDVGCGFGRYLMTLEDFGARAVGVDCFEPYLQVSPILAEREGRRPLRVVCANGDRLPFRDTSVDAVLCFRALAYMDPARALAEMGRVLRNDGVAVLAVSTFRDFVRVSVARFRSFTRPRAVATLCLTVANTLGVQWLGRRLVDASGMNPVLRFVHPTRKFLVRELRANGLEAVAVYAARQPDVTWIVSRRVVEPAAPA